MASNEVWGIDIGKSGVKAIKMRKAKNQLEVIAIDIIEYEQALSESEDVDREEQIRQALSEFQARNKIKSSDSIFASIPGQATFNRLITIPPVEAKRIKEVVTYEAQQQIPFPIEDVIWDYQLIGKADNKNVEEREVMLFAVRKELINNFLSNLAAAQLSVQGIQIAPLALYNFVRYERPEMEAGVAIDIGAEHTDLVIVDLDKLWLRAVPYAGDDITKALQKRFKIPYTEAEKLKIKSGKTKQSQRIFEVMKPVLKDLVGEVHRSVGYYKSSMSKNIKFEKMLFVGNATKLNGFEQFFTQNMQYNIEVLSQVKNIHVSPKINVNQFQSNIATFAVALGLAIQGLGKAKNDIKLIPSEISMLHKWKKIKPFLIAATALLCIAPILEYNQATQLQQKMLRLSKTISPIVDDVKDLQKRLKAVNNYGNIEKDIKKISHYGQGRDVWLTVINLLNEQYLETSEKIKNEDKPKFWIVKSSIDKKQTEESKTIQDPKNKRKTITEKTIKKHLLTQFTVVFKTVAENPLGNNDYLSNYLVNPLRKKCITTYGEKFGSIDILEGSWGFVAGVFPNVGGQDKKDHFKVTIKWILNLGE
ncbi:type IV pilus assembly protein PilM [Candidatus Uabimicrobium sp. HlEnr_7]|uniref:type IV pilus assembly protein PilM n=1 Tax=Candidatus Uabimicrobium helgolandensis TaxID=3095367 RepID=UPI003555D098